MGLDVEVQIGKIDVEIDAEHTNVTWKYTIHNTCLAYESKMQEPSLMVQEWDFSFSNTYHIKAPHCHFLGIHYLPSLS